MTTRIIRTEKSTYIYSPRYSPFRILYTKQGEGFTQAIPEIKVNGKWTREGKTNAPR